MSHEDVANQPPSPETWACDKDQACDLSWGRYVSVNGGQLMIFAIQLALLVAIASVLARGTARVSRRSVGLMSPGVLAAPFLVASWLVGTAHAPRSVVLSGVVAECTRAEYAAQGDTAPGQEPPVVTVFLQNQAGQTVAAQRLPFRVAGARYRMRVLAGIYTLAIVSGRGDDCLLRRRPGYIATLALAARGHALGGRGRGRGAGGAAGRTGAGAGARRTARGCRRRTAPRRTRRRCRSPRRTARPCAP